MLSPDRRQEIAHFLKNRRSLLKPSDLKLPKGGRRRVPGLRREEVAMLAGVSTEWYTWLEQAREVTPSFDTLNNIAKALCLDHTEHNHLLKLAGYNESNGNSVVDVVPPHIKKLIHHLGAYPAWVSNKKWDIIFWNKAANLIFGNLDQMTPENRNAFHLMYVDKRLSQTLMDWELHARGYIGTIHSEYAQDIDNTWFKSLIEKTSLKSPLFAQWWQEQNVKPYNTGIKHYNHPELGRLSFKFTTSKMVNNEKNDFVLTIYIPLENTNTEKKIQNYLTTFDEIVIGST